MHERHFPADESFVHFDFSTFGTTDLLDDSVTESQAETMQNEPRRLLGDAQIAANFVGTDSVLAIDQHPQSREPFVERDWRILENRPEFHGELPARHNPHQATGVIAMSTI